MRSRHIGLAFKHRPQRIDVVLHVHAGLRAEFAGRCDRRIEVRPDECAGFEPGLALRGLVFTHDFDGRLARQRIDEGLAVLVDALHLDALEEAGIQLRRRRRRVADARARDAGEQPEQKAGGDVVGRELHDERFVDPHDDAEIQLQRRAAMERRPPGAIAA